MAKLTPVGLKAKKVGEIVRDEGGLYGTVRATKEGTAVTFYYQYRIGAKRREMSCGTFPTINLASIRKNRDAARDLVTQGIDPLTQREADKAARQKALEAEIEAHKTAVAQAAAEAEAKTDVKAVFDKWVEIDLKSRSEGSRDELIRAWNKDVFPRIGTTPIKQVTDDDVLAIGDAIKAREADRLARRTFSELRQFFAFAVRRKYIGTDPTAPIKKSKEYKPDTERDRVLDEKEIRALALALPNAGLRDATRISIWIMLATLARVGELSKALWENVDLDARRWKIPACDSKNKKEHLIHLSDFAAEQFKALKAITGNRVFCYPSDGDETHIDTKALSKQFKDRQREKPLKNRANAKTCGALLIGNAGWTPHDLRRSGATLMGALGVNGDTIERCLNHTEESALRRIYQRHEGEEEQGAAWDRLGKRLKILSSPNSNVIALPAKSA